MPIPGKGLCKDDQGSGTWRPVLISSYDPKTEKFSGHWDGSMMEYVELTRINLLFDAEDPRIFAQRVV